MNNQSEANFITPILSAVAGIGTIFASISPLFQQKFLSEYFVRQDLIILSTILALVTVILTIWTMISKNSYSLFKGGSTNWGNTKLTGVILFLIGGILFYIFNVCAKNSILNIDLAAVFQMITYVLSFGFLGLSVGLLFRDSYGDIERKQKESQKYEKIRDCLIKSNKIKVDFEPESIMRHQFTSGEPLDWMFAYDVIFKTSNGKYRAIIHNEYYDLLGFVELKDEIKK